MRFLDLGKTSNDRGSDRSKDDLLEAVNPTEAASQSFEALLSSLHILNATRPVKTILVTSTQPDEGKTTITVNLAFTMTLTGKKVLILDADLRRPRIHKMLKLENTYGFGDILAKNLTPQEIIRDFHFVEAALEETSDVMTLGVVTSGRSSPNYFSTIGLPKLKAAIDYYKARYDYILFDSPPVLSVSDPALLAPMVDGTILILDAGTVAERAVKRAKDRIEQAGGHILGVVLNRFDERIFGPGYHPYCGYYDQSSIAKSGNNDSKKS